MDVRDFIIENGARPITASLFYGAKTERVLLVQHGFMSERKGGTTMLLANLLADNGISVLSVDLPEHGDRKNQRGTLTVNNAVSDLKKALAYAEKLSDRVSVFGTSLGAYFLLLAIKDEKDIEAVMAKSPALNPPKIITNVADAITRNDGNVCELKFIYDALLNMTYDATYGVGENDLYACRMAGFWGKLNLIYGTEDKLITREDIDSFTAINPTETSLTVLNGEPHRFVSDTARDAVRKWVSEIMLTK